jgi:hypothetical protein
MSPGLPEQVYADLRFGEEHQDSKIPRRAPNAPRFANRQNATRPNRQIHSACSANMFFRRASTNLNLLLSAAAPFPARRMPVSVNPLSSKQPHLLRHASAPYRR